MSNTNKPQVVKGLLKLKGINQSQKKTTIDSRPMQHQQQKKQVLDKSNGQKPPSKIEHISDANQSKTAAEISFQIAKKTRLIHKYSERGQLSMKERLEKRNKVLSKLPDHEDLFKTGEKIQKGY